MKKQSLGLLFHNNFPVFFAFSFNSSYLSLLLMYSYLTKYAIYFLLKINFVKLGDFILERIYFFICMNNYTFKFKNHKLNLTHFTILKLCRF